VRSVDVWAPIGVHAKPYRKKQPQRETLTGVQW
jgi:hypothetical protein